MDPKLIWRRVCKRLDDRNWKYEADEAKLAVRLTVNGEDIPIRLSILIYERPGLVSTLSFLPFDIAEDKRLEAAVAVCAINDLLLDGNFDLTMADGGISFRMAVPYNGGLPDESIDYLINFTCSIVDEYNDKLLMLNKGVIDLKKFLTDLQS